ncbi:SHOCT domain-containing protein [Nocardioides sambongensis]|uniref:SHOCT domain-containing protein n=1 Tax=Nocardioides sambongensis TaxID=2589074 RepID=UPI001128E8D2|nr:SHOCT domain-containing protein [Nocardioides sambongensis]
MRVPLIGLGVATLLVGLVVVLTATASLGRLREDLRAERELTSMEAWNNGTENFVRHQNGLDPLESEYDPGAIEERITATEQRRNIGWGVAGIGAVLAVVGVITPRTQRVEVLPAPDARPPGPRSEPPPGQSSRTVAPATGIEARFRLLAHLRDTGAITEAEYDERRRAILDEV